MMSLPPANEVWGKVIFLHLSVILLPGEGVPGQVNPRASTPPPLGQVSPHQSTSGWYTSYWNAFLFYMPACERQMSWRHLYFLHFFEKNASESAILSLPPTNEVWEGNVFTGICHSVQGWCACLVPGPFWWVEVGMPGPRSFEGVCWGVCIPIPQTWDLGYPPPGTDT